MKKLFLTLFFAFSVSAPSFALVEEYFNSFYCNYLYSLQVDLSDREILDFLYNVSNQKVVEFEKYLNSASCGAEKTEAIRLIDEEYRDFLENINFELNYVCHIPLCKRKLKKIKQTHKKFMCLLEKSYLK